ncbi:hypothetical protein [Janthinobacterium sp. 78]|uniref:hypothetical protein n=1 Tax=Janthinobacterium sp. 78 TaxID=2135631 RepID=UPI000D5F23FF|nr:hypothetical protein [Janthinobacterium sp. 78]PVX38180.1 hypothetical protein C8C92_4849 [Janthinobacterium sp. 78]
MDAWKMIGGAACGVVVIVALPVFGSIGAITAGGALLGASLGGGMGLWASNDAVAVEEARGETRGRTQAKTEYQLRLQELIKQYENATIHIAANSLHVEVMLSLVGVGMACAGPHAADSETALAVKEFACGQAMGFLPRQILNKIDRLVANPPNIKSAYARAGKVAGDSMALFDEMVNLVQSLDPSASHAAVWQQMRAA